MRTGLKIFVIAILFVGCGRADKKPNEIFDTTQATEFKWSSRRSFAADELTQPGVISYKPRFELWSDGMLKKRWLKIPAGQKIDTSNQNEWVFPIGTKVWKEFSVATPNGPRKVETRTMEKVSARTWEIATFVWNQNQSGADLAPDQGVPHQFSLAGTVYHDIPGLSQCSTCHGGSKDALLGVSLMQLSGAQGLLTDQNFKKNLTSAVQANFQMPGTPLEQEISGYLQSNCAHCHKSNGAAANINMPLMMNVDANGHVNDVLRGLINRPVMSSGMEIPGVQPWNQKIVVPHRPEISFLVQRTKLRDKNFQMPAIGTNKVDESFVDKLTQWVNQL